MLSSIRVPTLIIVGIEDTVTPIPFAKMMNQAISGSKLEVIPGGSHAAIIEESKRANQAIMQWANGMRQNMDAGRGQK
jgi:pimeloyl-ACP methyl ester carboxylesterase